MKTASAKAKGRGLQAKVVAKLLAAFPSLHPDDVKSTPMSTVGEDVQLSRTARKILDVQIECKKFKAFAVYTHYDQCSKTGKHNPLLVIEADRRKPLAVVDLDWFITLLTK